MGFQTFEACTHNAQYLALQLCIGRPNPGDLGLGFRVMVAHVLQCIPNAASNPRPSSTERKPKPVNFNSWVTGSNLSLANTGTFYELYYIPHTLVIIAYINRQFCRVWGYR